MANLTEQAQWEEGVYQLETRDFVRGGDGGVSNRQGKQLANRTQYLKAQIEQLANAAQTAITAKQLETARGIAMTGDASWSVNFDGSQDVTAKLTLAKTGVVAAQYGSATTIPVFTVNDKGQITAAQSVNIAQSITLTGDAAGQGTSQVAVTLVDTGVAPGIYGGQNSIPYFRVDSKGRLTMASSTSLVLPWANIQGKPTTLAGYGITDAVSATGVVTSANKLTTARKISITGDGNWFVNLDGSADVSAKLTLADSGVEAGSYGGSAAVPVITVDSKGRVTALTTAAAAAGGGLSTRGPVGTTFFWPAWVGTRPPFSYVMDGSIVSRAASPLLLEVVCPVVKVRLVAGSMEGDMQGDIQTFNNQFGNSGFRVESSALPAGTILTGVNDELPSMTFNNAATASGVFAVRLFPWGYNSANDFVLPDFSDGAYIRGDTGGSGAFSIGKKYDDQFQTHYHSVVAPGTLGGNTKQVVTDYGGAGSTSAGVPGGVVTNATLQGALYAGNPTSTALWNMVRNGTETYPRTIVMTPCIWSD
ncbi:hypothetical protein [Silvimonas soli]|uniref:hypothetical protein n=1 Tax=Silvimonas soli TaxID=2980100 RepID=UPI0024B3988A|nr:hypothetical protein [Silvimonas soli]